MVNLRIVAPRGAARFKMTAKTFTQLAQSIPNYKRMDENELFDSIQTFIQTNESERETRIKQNIGDNANVIKVDDIKASVDNPYNYLMNKRLPISKESKLYVTFIRPSNTDPQNPNAVVPLPPPSYPRTGKRGRPPLPPPLPDSEDIAQLSAIIRKRFRPIFGVRSDVNNFKDGLYRAIHNITRNKRMSDYIFSNLDIREVEVRNDANYLLYYVMRNGYRDFGDFVINYFCKEADDIENHITKKQFGCFWRCAIEQLPMLFSNKDPASNARGVKKNVKNLERIAHLDSISNGAMTVEKMKEVASEFNVNLTILDIELKTIANFDYSSRACRAKNHTVTVVVKDNHVYSLKPHFKKSVSRNGCHHLLERRNLEYKSIDPITDESILPPKLGSVKIIESGEISNGEEGCETITPANQNISLEFYEFDDDHESNKGKDRIYYTDNLLSIYAYYYYKHRIVGCLFESNKISQLSVRIDDSTVYYFRNREPYDFDIDYPGFSTFTVGSLSKYLFRKFALKESLPKMANPLVHTIFKGLCRPFKDAKVGEWRGSIYVFDLTKAYFNSSNDLFIPRNEIVWEANIVSNDNIHLMGVVCQSPSSSPSSLRKEGEEEGDYIWKLPSIGDKFDAYIPVEKRTNVLREYGEILRDKLRPSDYKMFFNSLIGSMHPSDVNQSSTVIFHNETDFCRFLLIREAKNIVDIDIDEELSIYKVKFMYDSNFISGFCVPYFPAQIIQRCNEKVKKLREFFINRGDDVLMSMTDSVVVRVSNKIDLTSTIFEGWDCKIDNAASIDIQSIGAYCIKSCNGTVIKKTDNYRSAKQDLNDEFSYNGEIIDFVKISNLLSTVNPHTHQLIIGSAGVGKSRWIKENYFDVKSGNFLITASTGIAASSHSSSATTLHSAFGIIQNMEKTPSSIVKRLSNQKILDLQKFETLIIDEAWMVREDDMILVDKILKIVNNSAAIFGGKKLILVGDDRQLSAVKGTPFIGCGIFNGLSFEKKEIPFDQMRSRMCIEYKMWTDALRRKGMCIESIKRYIDKSKDRFASSSFDREEEEGVLTCFYTNKEVEGWNEAKRANISKIVDGEPIILRKNIDVRKGLYNGKIGSGKWIGDELFFEYTDDMGNINQKSLKGLEFKKNYFLAYAITVHKCQGLTLNSINIGLLRLLTAVRPVTNLEMDTILRLFYVAFTRVRSFERVYLF